MFKVRAQQLLSDAQQALAHELRNDDLARPTIVFSPHPDDETLGCGGTIIRKRSLGASVRIVFMTDGSASHRRLMLAKDLATVRAREARAACKILGVDEPSICFLNFEDGQLATYGEAATRKVAELLSVEPCQDVYVPYIRESMSDHKVTRSVVLAALKSLQKTAIVYEYPIWFWRHWPWTAIPASDWREASRSACTSVRSWLEFTKDLRWTVHVGDVLARKRLALSQYRSQVARLRSDVPWPNLCDISSGEFVECFFRDRESFLRHRFS